jgi:predicted GNAT family acetyltransferase
MMIEHRPEGELGSFVALDEGGEQAGELAYRLQGGNLMILDHTDVEDKYQGKGVGKQLVQAAVEHARSHGIKLRPLCTYAYLLFERNKDWADCRE